MSNTLEYVEYLKVVKAKTSELDNLLSNEFGFKLSQVLESYTSLFGRFCPHKIGDRIQLKETLDIPEGSGWYGSKHFLIEGAIATVRTCEYRNNSFCFGLVFDDESYVDYRSGEIKPEPEDDKHLYYLSEEKIESLS